MLKSLPKLRKTLLQASLASACTLSFVVQPAWSETLIQAQSQTRSVAAYQGLALVNRQVQLPSLQPGAYEIRISDLPQDLNENSLSITGQGQARIRIHHVQLQPLAEAGVDKELQALQQAVKKAQQELAVIGSHEELNKTHQTLLRTFQQQLSTQAQDQKKSLSVRDWEAATAFALGQQGQMLNSQLSLQVKKAELQEKLQKMNQELRDMSLARRPKQQASLFLTADSAGSATLQVSYLIGNVSWNPTYEARLDSEQQKLRLIYQGDLAQRSGENWQQVRLTLSTATPVLNQRPPGAQRWHVGPLLQPKSRPAPAPPMAQSMRNEVADAFEPDADIAVEYSQSEIEQTGLSVRFQLPEAQSVPSSTQTRRLAMASRDFSYTSAYKIVPRQSTLAFLEVQIKNDSELPFLPGPMRTYLGDEFTGVNPIELIRPGQTTRLNFGVDQGLKVEWKELSRNKRSTGVLQDKEELTVIYQAEITNYKKQPANLRVLEPAPQVASEEIEVKLMQAEPKISETSDEGLHTWHLTAQPWEKKTIQLTYRMTYPKGMVVQF